MVAAMLFMLAVNASAADQIVCKNYYLDSDVSYYNETGDKLISDTNVIGTISLKPTIEKQQNSHGTYEYSICDVNTYFTLRVPRSNYFDSLKIDLSNVSVVTTIRIDYNIPYGRVGTSVK